MKRLIILFALIAFAAQTQCCGGTNGKTAAPKKKSAPKIASDREVRFVEDEDLEGLRMVLREAGAPSQDTEAVTLAKGKALNESEISRLLDRAEGIKLEKGDRKDFVVRKGSKPPPRTGETVDISFPPPIKKRVPDMGKPGELEVLRFAPEGEVPMAPHLSLTFSRPMVSVTSQEEASKIMPARLDPVPDGDWRWLGTRTLLFKPDVRFPMATDYKVVVPVGTSSSTGDKLKKKTEFSFSTPAPAIERKHPTRGPHDLNPVIFLEFDQKINPEAMVEHMVLEFNGRKRSLKLATRERIDDDDVVRNMVEHAKEGRWTALVSDKILPKGTSFKVVVKKGAPSAEGPKTTPGKQTFSFFTYKPLRIERHRCGWRDECPPTTDWRIEFNNPLDEEEFDPDSITVEPTVPGLTVRHWGDTVSIGGLKQGRTRYTVTIPASIQDKFGQTLGEDEHITFDVGPAEKTLFGPGKGLVTLDPMGAPALAVHSINHKRLKVKIHRVTPADWVKWLEWRQKYRYETTKPGPMPGKRVFSRSIKVKGENDRSAQTLIDFKRHLRKGYGQFLVHVEPAVQPKEKWRRQEVMVWVQVTDLGLAAFVDYKEMLAWVTTLKDGKAISGAVVELLPGKKTSGKSDDKGLARMRLTNDSDEARLLVARVGDDAVILPPSDNLWYGGGGGGGAVEQNDLMRWYTFDDRGLYRPGEKVRVKGWMRKYAAGVGGDIEALAKKPQKVKWKLRGPRGNDLSSGDVDVSKLGGFDLTLELPKDVNLGTAWLEIDAVGAGDLYGTTHSHAIKIQEFRRPEFEVSAAAQPGPYVLGEEVITTVKAAYYAGGGLPNAPVRWRAYATPASYTPPDRDEYEFGMWSPWWRPFNKGSGGKSETLEGKTDAIGEHHLGIHFEAVNPPRPMNVHAEATVTDVNRQAWTASRDLLVHPSAFYLGLKTERGFVDKDDPIVVESLVVDIDGKIIPGVDVTLRMFRVLSRWKGGKWKEEELDPVECSVTSDEDSQKCTFHPKLGGSYRIVGEIRDPLERLNRTEMRIWVAGQEQPPARNVEKEKLTLIPEKQEYQPGEKATFLLQSPFYPADGVLTIRRSGLVSEEHFALDGPTRQFAIPIVEAHIPDVTVQIDLVGSATRNDDDGKPRKDLPRRVAFASGSLTFKVPPLTRTLDVKATPRKTKLDPGAKTTIDLLVVDAGGKPVNGAELVVVAADESVLALTGYKLPDPIDVFYTARGSGVSDYHMRHQLVLSDPSMLAVTSDGAIAGGLGNMPVAAQAMMTMGPMGSTRSATAMPSAPRKSKKKGGKSGKAADRRGKMAEIAFADDLLGGDKGGFDGDDDNGSRKIAVRTDFNALALFAPDVKTDSRGKASVSIKLPDSLTRYRVMVVAVAGGKQFGTGESNITARLPLMVRPSPPRFLNFGDRFELPVILQNQTDEEMTVSVAVRATNVSMAQTLDKAVVGEGDGRLVTAGQRVTVPANDRVEVRFPTAAQMAGKARFQIVASSRRGSDAANFELPVWTPATSEAFATYGEIDKGAIEQPVRAPGKVWPQFGGLEITTSSTQLQALTDAVLYLVSYPYDCNEQIASRILAIAALRDVLSAFESQELPTPKELKKSVGRDLKKLAARQNSNGGFSFWRKGDRDWPYLTIHVASAMARAKTKSYEVPDVMWNRAMRYLKNIETHIPHWYSKESRWSIRAYALNVLHLMGATDKAKAAALLTEAGIKSLPMEAQGWILPVLQAGKKKDEVSKIVRNLTNKVTETAAGAHFVTSYSDGAHVLLHSNRRVDGIILEALIEVAPKSDLIPKLVRGLLAHRVRGKWSNTQENAFILLAMDRYFNVFEKVDPDFIARAWLGNNFIGEHEFKGRTTERARMDIPMSFIAERKGNQSLVLQKDGVGRMYYRIGMRYAPKSLDLEPVDYGFAIERVYEAVDDPGDVKQDKDGTWRIAAGARVRVRLTMVAPMRRYHVALVDPLPAGLEPINPALAVSGSVPDDPKAAKSSSSRYWWWWRPWYEHQNMRDERVEAFTSLLWAGVHEYTYVARATTPGEYVVPPTKAEEMYHPETFGRAGTDKVIVKGTDRVLW